MGAVYFAGFTAVFFVLTIYFQEGLGYSALMSGLASTPFAAGGAVTASIGGRLVTRYGRAVVTGGLVVVVVGLIGVDVVLSLVEGPAVGLGARAAAARGRRGVGLRHLARTSP